MATVQFLGTRDGWLHADEPGDGLLGLGDWLRRAREARGLTLDGITQETRIPRRHLEAIEHGDLAALPEFYQRAEVRAFARVVGVDEQLALARLQSVVTPVQPQVERERPQRARRFSIVLGAAALVAAIAVAALVGRTMFGGANVNAAASTANRTPAAPAELTSRPAASESDARDASILALADPAPAPAPPGAVSELIVTTQPPGARVTVNGIGWGTSPVAIKYLPPGDKRIRVSKDGYGAAERVLALDEGGRRSVDIPLTAAP